MTYAWFKSKFTAADLNKKTVAFRVPLEQGGIAAGEGKFEALQNASGCIAVAIIYHYQQNNMMCAGKVFIPVEAAGNIVRNPSGSKCEFSVIAA
jgi:hypothetical protein